MPKCVVRKCPHHTGNKSMHPQIVLHSFPKDLMLIQEWLRLSGMQEENLELVSLEILEDRRSGKFRMCSAHFTQDCYVLKGSRQLLKANAKPSKFPEPSVLDFAHPPMMHRIAQRARIEQGLAFSADGQPLQEKCNCHCHTHLSSMLVNSSTQTEVSDFLILETVVPYFRLGNHWHIGEDHGYCQTLQQEQSTAENIIVPSCLNIIPVKKWERTDFQLHQEKSSNENGFLNPKATRSDVENVDEEMITSDESSSFDIITVENWGSAEVQIKQEDFQNEIGFVHLEDTEGERYVSDMPSFHTVSNQKQEDYITKIKKEFIIQNGNDSSALEKPIHATVVPSFVMNPDLKKEDDEIKKPDHCKQSTSSLIENSVEDVYNGTKPKRIKNYKDTNLLDPPKNFSDEVPSTPSLSLEEKYAKEKKYVVFESCLDVLLLNMRCQQKYCSERIKQCDKHMVGSLLEVFATCCRGHNFKLWESQPRVNGVGAGNVILATMLILTGSSFSKIKGLCDIFALQIFSESFHSYKDEYIFPSIDQRVQEDDESEVRKIEEDEMFWTEDCERERKEQLNLNVTDIIANARL
ncbi:uncharacterized protein ACMZJ9_002299 [Mantella aurantiaca]